MNYNYNDLIIDFLDCDVSYTQAEADFLYDLLEQQADIVRAFILFSNIESLNFGDLTDEQKKRLAFRLDTFKDWRAK